MPSRIRETPCFGQAADHGDDRRIGLAFDLGDAIEDDVGPGVGHVGVEVGSGL